MSKILELYQNIDSGISYLFSNTSNESKLLKKIFNKKKINLIDVGCNLGTYIDLSKKNLNISKIYAFEPSKTCFNYLKKKYKDKNIEIINEAISDKQKKSTFYEREISSQSSLINKNNKFIKNLRNKSIYKIKCNTLDLFYKNNKLKEKYDLVKVDCEGEDFNVLKGAKKLLKDNKITLIKIEITSENDNFFKIINFLNKYKYKLISITKTKYKNQKLTFMDAYFGKIDL